MRKVLAVGVAALGSLISVPAAQAAAITITADAATAPESGSVSFTVARPALGANLDAVQAVVRFGGGAGNAASCPADVSADGCEVSVTIPALGTSVKATAAVVADTFDEADEVLTATLASVSGSNTVASPGTAMATITDDDPTPTLTVAAASAVEGTGAAATTLRLPVTLSAPSGRAVDVGYDLTAGSAAAEDVALTSGTVSIPAGQTTGTIPAQVVADALDEGGSETFTATLKAPTNATIAGGSATGTITDDDVAQLAVADVAAFEGSGGASSSFALTVTLSTPATRAISVDYATADGTAVAPGDYAAASGRVSFAPGETAKELRVLVAGDGTVEPDERFEVRLAAPVGAPIGRGTATGTIRNDDAAPPAVLPGAGAGTVPQLGPGDTTAPKGKLARFALRRPRTLTSSFSCPTTERGCLVAVTVFTLPTPRSKVKRLRRELRVARRTFLVAGGTKAALRLPVKAAVLRVLRRAERVEVRGYAVVYDAAGNVGTTQAGGVLKP